LATIPAKAGNSLSREFAPLGLILLGAAVLRLTDLSYSHFQGDEIKALYPDGAAFPDFLFMQKKGPVQFLVTLLVRSVTGGYAEWITRLPFALVSLLSVYVLYRLVRDLFGRGPALFSAALFGSCGLLVGFGRIVQYQSFCILFVLLTALFLFRWLREGNPRLLYPALLSYALALLTHYDALTFLPTVAVLLIGGFRRERARAHTSFVHLVGSGIASAGLAGLFYIPYMLQPSFSDVKTYLLGRVASGLGVRPFVSTYDLLGLYLPPFSLVVIVPVLLYGISCLLRRPRDLQGPAVVFWFVSVFAFYMLLGGDPRSHVYTFFLPGLVLVAIGLEGLVGPVAHRGLQGCLRAGIWVLIVAFGCATYTMLVDHTVEHPWYRKTILGYPLPNLETRQVQGVFGFPYQRGLEKVGVMFQTGQLKGTYDSNERDVMADYYFRAPRAVPPDYYVYVHRPLSLDRQVPQVVARHYRWVGEVVVRNRTTIDIFESPLHAGPLEHSPGPGTQRRGATGR
jgi:4-amino-4-deoxy-L-arabinose transferase-like glycosyltransferase